MRTVQEYFEENHKKDSLIAKCDKPTEELEGNKLVIKDFFYLETLDLTRWEQIKEVSIENCPKLNSIFYATPSEKMVIVPQKEKEGIDWLCIIGLTSGIIAIALHIYKWYKNKDKNKD